MGAVEAITGDRIGIRSNYAEPCPTTAACLGAEPNEL